MPRRVHAPPEAEPEDREPWAMTGENLAEELRQAERCFLAGLGIVAGIMDRLPGAPKRLTERPDPARDMVPLQQGEARRALTSRNQENLQREAQLARVKVRRLEVARATVGQLNSVACRVRARRLELTLSHAAVARQAGVHPSVVSQIERGRLTGRRKSLGVLRVIAALGLGDSD